MEAGRFSSEDRRGMKLIDKLYDAREFLATDPRDKLYGVLGMVADAEDEVFRGLVNYEEGVSAGEVYARFARAMVKKGDGFGVLMQAGLQEGEAEGGLPSWVPVCGHAGLCFFVEWLLS
jgi:hypothetical protein